MNNHLKIEDLKSDLDQGKKLLVKRHGNISYYLFKIFNKYYWRRDDIFEEFNIKTFGQEEVKFVEYYIENHEMPEVGDEMYLLKDCGGYKKGNRVIVGSVSDSTVSVEIHDTTLYLPLSCLGYLKGKCEQCLNPMQKGICECEAEVNRTSNREEEEKLDCCKFCNEHTIWEFCPCCGKKLNK